MKQTNKGCLIIVIIAAVFCGAVWAVVSWSVESAVQMHLATINAQAAANAAKLKAIETAQEEIQIEQEVIKKGIRLIEHRTRSMDPAVSRSSADRGRRMLTTAYTCGPESTGKRPGDRGYCITASGYKLTNADAWKVVAADPAYYKFGQQLHIDGVGIVTVRDTGGDIKGPNRLDLFVGKTDVRAALNWGKRMKEVLER